MSRPKVLFIDTVHPVLNDTLQKFGYYCDEQYTTPYEVIRNVIHDYEGIVIRSRFKLDSDLLKRAKKLRFIARSGSGMENIDVKFAKKMGVECINAPEANRMAVGEHALGMLLGLFHKIISSDKEVRLGVWQREPNRGEEVGGKTVGIIGYGNTGSAFAEKLKGLNVRILAFDKYKSGFGNTAVEESTLEQIKAQADIISLHIPLSEETHHIIDENFIKDVAKPFVLINTSRGNHVKTEALVQGLQTGKIKGACLDVLEIEKPSFEAMNNGDHLKDKNLKFLTESHNVVLTPHVAGWTTESYRLLSEVLAKKIGKLGSPKT